MSKRLLLGTLCALVLGAAAFVGYRQYQQTLVSEQLVFDSLRIIRELEDVSKDSSEKGIEAAYKFQQHVLNAQLIVKPWLTDSHAKRARVIRAVTNTLSDFNQAAEAYLRMHKRIGDTDDQLAVFEVKLDAGRAKFIDIAAEITEQEWFLTNASKRRLVDYINRAFQVEVSQYHKSKDNLSYGIAAVLMIKGRF